MRISSLVALFLVGLSVNGCIAPSHRARPPFNEMFGFDGTPKDADQLAKDVSGLLPAMSEDGDHFTLFAVDNRTTPMSTSAPRSDVQAYAMLRQIIDKKISVTDLCAFFENMADRCEHLSEPTVILLISDGKNDGDADMTARRIERAAKRLADNPHVVAVMVIGYDRDTRSNWKSLPEMLQPLQDAGKFLLQSDGQTNPRAVLARLDTLRQKAEQAASLPSKKERAQ